MPISDLDKLAALIGRERDALLARWREQVRALPAARHLDAPTLNDHLPQLIGELAAALKARSDETIPQALSEASPPAHGMQRVQDGYDIVEAHDGSVSVESQEGLGSTFRFTLPRQSAAAAGTA